MATKDGDGLAGALRCSFMSGVRQTGWLLAVMLPVSLAVALLQWSGLLPYLARFMEPLFRLMGLPGEASLAFFSSNVLNIYSGIAVMGTIPLDARQVTILAMMMLTSHSLPLEITILHKAGLRGGFGWQRLLLSLLSGMLLNLVLPASPGAGHTAVSAAPEAAGFVPMLAVWLAGALALSLKVAVIVISLMVLQRLLEEWRIIPRLARLCSPLMAFLGLTGESSFLWIVANAVGLSYGGAIIVNEMQEGDLDEGEASLLCRSIAVCHSLLEDTLLFAAVGAATLWITLPRLLLAAAVVWARRAASMLVTRRSRLEKPPEGS